MFNAAEAIPYKNEKHKYYIINAELKKNRYVEIWDKFIYSSKKWGVKENNKEAWKLAQD